MVSASASRTQAATNIVALPKQGKAAKVSAALYARLCQEAAEAETRLRSILPHVFSHTAAESVTRRALQAVGELSEHLMRLKATAEADERLYESAEGESALLSLGDTALLLGMSTDKVASMIDDGVIPHLYIGGMLRVPSDRLRAIIDNAVRYGRSS